MTSKNCLGYECVGEAAATADSGRNVDSSTTEKTPLTEGVNSVKETGLPHSTDNTKHNYLLNNGVSVDLHLDLTNQKEKLNTKIMFNDDGYDTPGSIDDLTPEVQVEEDKVSVFRFTSSANNIGDQNGNTSNVAEIQKREKDARDWALKSLLVIGAASVALSDIHESYVKYCEGNGTKPLPISQLRQLLKTVFPGAAIQNEELHGIKTCILIGLRLLVNSTVNQIKLGNDIIVQPPNEIDQYDDLDEESSDQGYNSDHSQTDEQSLCDEPQNINSSENDFENVEIKSDPEDLNLNIPQQLNGGNTPRIRFYEPFYEAQIEQASKIREMRRDARRYQQVENRSTAFVNFNQNSSITVEDEVESCKGAAKRLTHVITWMKDNGHTKILLRDFAHSATCAVSKCSPFCKMFKRVRRHVVAAKHQCVLLRLYSLLLRLHVNSCTSDNCGLQACPTLRANKSVKRPAPEVTASILAKRPTNGNMIHNESVVPNSVHFTPPAPENGTNPYVVVLAVPANRLQVSSIANLGNQK